MALSPEEVVQRQVETYNAHDLEGFASCFAEEATLTNLASGEVFAQGREQVVEVYRKTFARRPRIGVKIENRSVIGPIVIDTERLITNDDQAVAIYRVQNGEISNLWLIPQTLL